MSAANRSSSAPVRATALSTIRTTPKWSIASKPEIKMSFQSAPGPGAYNVPSADKFGKFGSPPHFSIAAAGRTDVGKGHQPPGPGAYTPDKGMGRLRGGCIARSGRGADSARSQSPGPGAYKPDWSNDYPAPPKYGFGTSTRPPLNMPNDAPAPGTYPVPDGVTGHITFASTPKFSFRSRHFLKADDLTSMGPNTAQATSFG